jgi:glycosyltransferase involved in cell wall biosynthesis
MKIALVTDAWLPQVNGVVTTLLELVRDLESRKHEVLVIHPGQFKTKPCPGYSGIDLAQQPRELLSRQLDDFVPDAIHVATEGPLGWAARGYCRRNKLQFTTAFHTKFPEILNSALRVPLWIGYALFRHFHKHSAGIMVPTQGVLEMLRARGFKNLRGWTHGVDSDLFRFLGSARIYPPLSKIERPVSLFVGRVSYEKNIKAFLEMETPGTKVVCGVGPLEETLKSRYPGVRWLGLLPRDELAMVYAAADVFVFPSRSETFGLVMLEAMACGTPVAAYPVDGPLEVLNASVGAKGGALHEDLKHAFTDALLVPRWQARERAMDFSWEAAGRLFQNHLVKARPSSSLS